VWESGVPLWAAPNAPRWYESYGALGLDDAQLSRVLTLAVAADAITRQNAT
jgi:hypothetical protein